MALLSTQAEHVLEIFAHLGAMRSLVLVWHNRFSPEKLTAFSD
jgi:hypothetical protein